MHRFKRQNYSTVRGFSVLFIVLVGLFNWGCDKTPPSQVRDATSSTATEANRISVPDRHDVVVYVDEALLRKPFAIIGATIENTSNGPLRGIVVELELQRRSDGRKERREVTIKPADLQPGQRGSYSLKIMSQEWSDSRLISLRSDNRKDELAFKISPGNRRPPERLVAPTPTTRVVNAQRPRRRSGDDEFINTPDNPVSVP